MHEDLRIRAKRIVAQALIGWSTNGVGDSPICPRSETELEYKYWEYRDKSVCLSGTYATDGLLSPALPSPL